MPSPHPVVRGCLDRPHAGLGGPGRPPLRGPGRRGRLAIRGTGDVRPEGRRPPSDRVVRSWCCRAASGALRGDGATLRTLSGDPRGGPGDYRSLPLPKWCGRRGLARRQDRKKCHRGHTGCHHVARLPSASVSQADTRELPVAPFRPGWRGPPRDGRELSAHVAALRTEDCAIRRSSAERAVPAEWRAVVLALRRTGQVRPEHSPHVGSDRPSGEIRAGQALTWRSGTGSSQSLRSVSYTPIRGSWSLSHRGRC